MYLDGNTSQPQDSTEESTVVTEAHKQAPTQQQPTVVTEQPAYEEKKEVDKQQYVDPKARVVDGYVLALGAAAGMFAIVVIPLFPAFGILLAGLFAALCAAKLISNIIAVNRANKERTNSEIKRGPVERAIEPVLGQVATVQKVPEFIPLKINTTMEQKGQQALITSGPGQIEQPLISKRVEVRAEAKASELPSHSSSTSGHTPTLTGTTSNLASTAPSAASSASLGGITNVNTGQTSKPPAVTGVNSSSASSQFPTLASTAITAPAPTTANTTPPNTNTTDTQRGDNASNQPPASTPIASTSASSSLHLTPSSTVGTPVVVMEVLPSLEPIIVETNNSLNASATPAQQDISISSAPTVTSMNSPASSVMTATPIQLQPAALTSAPIATPSAVQSAGNNDVLLPLSTVTQISTLPAPTSAQQLPHSQVKAAVVEAAKTSSATAQANTGSASIPTPKPIPPGGMGPGDM
jgi:hypothetical protein